MDTILERIVRAGIAEQRGRAYLAEGWVRVDGQVVTDPQQPAPVPARWALVAP